MQWPSDLVMWVSLAAVAIVLLVIVLQRRRWKRRAQAWAQAAGMLGLAPLEEPALPPWSSGLEFFRRGHSRRVRSGVQGRSWSADVVLADYQYTTGSGNSQSTHHQTVCLLHDPELDLPHFLLRRERALLDRIGELFGAKDFDFEEDPAFSQAFVLKGEDEAAVRALFAPALRAQLVQVGQGRFYLEGQGQTLLLHRGKLLEPENAGELLNEVVQLVQLVRR
jgi:hypothetical protein